MPGGSSSSTPYLNIPAGKSIKVTMNLTGSLTGDGGLSPSFIGTDQQIDIKILTSLTNIFEETYKLPTPVISYSTETATIGTVQRDMIVLDGSQSSSVNATISNWNWTIMNATQTYTNGQIDPVGNCSDISDLSTVGVPPYFNSKIARFSPQISGPFCVNLTVTDSNGMVATSPYQLIPEDAAFSPAANLIVTRQLANSINVTIKDINGHPVPNAIVNYVLDVNQFGNLSLSKYVDTSDQSGNSNITVISGIGSIKITSGSLPAVEVAVNGSS
jgi:hypothetical protein